MLFSKFFIALIPFLCTLVLKKSLKTLFIFKIYHLKVIYQYFFKISLEFSLKKCFDIIKGGEQMKIELTKTAIKALDKMNHKAKISILEVIKNILNGDIKEFKGFKIKG